MANTYHHQSALSEQMLILHEFKSSDFDISYEGAIDYSNLKRVLDSDTNRELRLLDIITLALATGRPGDVYAAAFDKREGFRLVLAKNEPPNEDDDMVVVTEFISLIQSSEVTYAGDLPFLIRRCRGNIEKRIHNLCTIIQDDILREFFGISSKLGPRDCLRTSLPR
ncbi:hypothetical protein H0H92_010897 [Tricholoma furcatifolium]|nr:hypothetical protein H0H92_010897 [Tricholoma furcatifolium]